MSFTTEGAIKLTLQLTSFLVVVIALVIVSISAFRSSQADSLVRFCVVAEPGEQLDGIFELDTSGNSIYYSFFYNTTLLPIQSILLRGPRLAGQFTGPIAFSLCGAPNMVDVCDTITVPGQVAGTIIELQPGSLAVLPMILSIRLNPMLYYLEFVTAAGTLRGSLQSTCGFP